MSGVCINITKRLGDLRPFGIAHKPSLAPFIVGDTPPAQTVGLLPRVEEVLGWTGHSPRPEGPGVVNGVKGLVVDVFE